MRRETEEQLAHEEDRRAIVEQQLQSDEFMYTPITILKTQEFCPYDWMLMRGTECIAWGEFKHFNRSRVFIMQTGELWVSLGKLTTGRELQGVSGKPFVLFVELEEGLFFHVLDFRQHYTVKYLANSDKTGRTYRSAVGIIPSSQLHDFKTERVFLWEHLNNADQVDNVA